MRPPLLLQCLLDPGRTEGLSPAAWDLLIRQGRRANLLSRLASLLEPQLQRIPEAPRRHLQGALMVARRQVQTTRWEVHCIQSALAPLGVRPVLLKGAAYLLADMPASQGRLFGDVDILVPKAAIAQVEQALLASGWTFSDELDAYDQRYYRDWMHEIPPLGHAQRGTSLDVHHTILPPTARVKVNTAALFDDLRPLDSQPGVDVLAPTTMLLHSAAHLFHEGELDKGLRDLFDLDALLRDFCGRPGFNEELLPRARTLGLTRPLYYALRYCRRWLGTPVPDDLFAAVERAAAPSGLTLWLMDACYDRALQPMHASCDSRGTGWARMALYVRSHWLRMPVGLLSLHLARKAWRRLLPPKVEGEKGA
ncbi:MAG: nucleotidyltransferase family protein [Roseateles sp.]